MDLSDLRHGRARLGRLKRDEQAAASFAVVATLRPLAELGGDAVGPADLARLLDEAPAAMRRASVDALHQLLAAAEAMPVLASSGRAPAARAHSPRHRMWKSSRTLYALSATVPKSR